MNLNSLDDYQANLAQIERARQVLDAYQTMNEDAKNKFEYQQELARKIAEGDRARQELEVLRHREALAIAAPRAPPSVPQAAPPAYVQTTARIEEIPTHGHAEQGNPYPSNAQPHWRVQRQEPAQQHNYYTGTPQYAGDSAFRPYYRPEQQSGNQQAYPTNQPSGQYQSSPAWSAYGPQPSQHYQQQRPHLPTQAPTPDMRPTRPAPPHARAQTQRPYRDHSQQGATAVSNPVPFSKSQPNNASSTPSGLANSSSSVVAPERVSSSTPEMQNVPYTHETTNIRPAAPEARPQTQQMTEQHRNHSQQGAVIPVSNRVALSSSTPSGFANSSNSVVAPERVSSSTSATQNVPYTHETINIRPAAPEARHQTQRMTEQHRDHSQQGAIPVSNPIAFSKSQPNNASSKPSGFANPSSSVAAPEPVSSSTPETQKVPYTHETINVRPAAPEARPQTHEPHRDRSQHGAIAPVSNQVTFSKSQPSNASSALSSFANSSSSVAAPGPVLSSTLETQKSDLIKNLLPTQSQAPTTPPTLYKPTSDAHLHRFTSNLDLVRYLTASYSSWVNDMPLDSYYPISNTQYYVWKRRDNVPLLIYRNASQEYTCMDIRNLIPQYALAAPSGKRENTHPTTPNQSISPSNLPQTKTLQPAQVTATIPAPPQSMGANTQPMATYQIRLVSSPSSQSENLQAVQVTTPVLTVKSNLPTQPSPGIDLHLNKGLAQASPKRSPADADKRNLARDILRALSLKRHRPPESPGTQIVERPAKRREQEPSAPLPNEAPGTALSDVGNPSLMSARPPTTPLRAPVTSTEVSTVRSPTLGLPPVRIAELPTEPEPKQSVEDVSSTMEEALASGASQSTIMDVDETTDDATNSLDRLTIQEQTVTPAAEGEQVLHARIEEIEDGEIQVPSDAITGNGQEGVEEEEEIEEGEIRMTQLPEGDRRPTTPITPIRKNVEGDAKPVKTPLFLPSPSPSPPEAGSRQGSARPPPDSSNLDEDSSMANSLRDEAVLRRQQHKSHHQRSSRKREFYILVPSLPSYVRKYKEQEARQRKRRKLLAQERDEDGGRARSPSADITSDPRVQLTIRNSVTRIAERRCKWGGCDAVLNSSQNLFEHLKRNHSTPDSSKRYILCNWSRCGDHVRNEQIEEHLGTHSFPSFLCPYADCDESFRSVQALVRHTDAEHASDELKSTPDPFSPHVQEPPPIPSKVPDYLIKSGLVRQEPIPRARHAVLGPWVYNNIAGPVKVTKRYNAAKEKPAEYGFLQSSAKQFSTNPSQPAKIRDLEDLPSGEVSEMISEGLYLWPPQETPSVVISSSEDELDGFGLVNNLVVAPIGDKSPVTHQSSEEDAVETMLTGQLGTAL